MSAPTRLTPEQRTERARIAAEARWNNELGEERRRERATERIAKLVATAPPLNPEQIARLRALLASGEAGAVA